MNPSDISPLEVLRQVYQRQNFVLLDTETTGLNEGEICEIALIDHTGKTLLDQRVKPLHGIPWDAQRIHGISEAMVADSPTWREVAPQVQAMITGKEVLVYNAVYDRKMMHKSAEAAGIPKIDWKAIAPFFCVMEAYAEYYGEWNEYHGNYRWHKLTFAASTCGVNVVNAHSALGDCLMTLGVVQAICTREKAG